MAAVSLSLRYSILFIIACLAQPSIQNTHYADINGTIVAESVQPCHLYGDSDIYGIGIRISLYIQWGVIILALVGGVEEEIKSTRRGFNIVSIAVLINTFISATNGSFAVLELFIVSTLIIFLSAYFITPFGGRINVRYVQSEVAGVPVLIKQETKVDILSLDPLRIDPIGIAVLLLVDSAFLFSQPWLCFEIIKQGNNSVCKPVVWVFFTSIQLNGKGWIIFLRFFSIVSIVAGIIATGLASWALVLGILGIEIKEPTNWRSQGNPPPTDPESNLPLCGCIPRQPFRTLLVKVKRFLRTAKNNTLRLLVAATGSIFIAFVEMTIKVNHIDLRSAPLTATSQLLPFLVALFSAFSLLWVSVRKVKEEKKNEEEILRIGSLLHRLQESFGRV